MRSTIRAAATLAIAAAALLPAGRPDGRLQAQEPVPGQAAATFQSGVDLVRITATVTDGDGRFVTGLRRQDFVVYDDGVKQEISQFSTDRAPVSLGILLDASGRLSEQKLDAARAAIDRFLDLLDKEDEMFFVEFAGEPKVTQDWTADRRLIARAARDVRGRGNTALYDAIADAIPRAESGSHRKKALLVISDGNDSLSKTSLTRLQESIRESEVLVYALGIDGDERQQRDPPRLPPVQGPTPGPTPFPFPPRRPRIEVPQFPIPMTPPIAQTFPQGGDERVDADVLRRITDATGGHSEIVRGTGGLSRATARIADELRRQYELGFTSRHPKDARWHSIRVEIPGRRVTIRARQGYLSS
jgi:VWFA-related protein